MPSSVGVKKGNLRLQMGVEAVIHWCIVCHYKVRVFFRQCQRLIGLIQSLIWVDENRLSHITVYVQHHKSFPLKLFSVLIKVVNNYKSSQKSLTPDMIRVISIIMDSLKRTFMIFAEIITNIISQQFHSLPLTI